jgi:hypothetical protein
MALPKIEAVDGNALPEFADFLHANLNGERSPAQWEQALRVDWGGERPNFGFIMREQDRIVGGIGAIYASRPVRGRIERFCNITSWCVLESHRKQSMRLAMAVVAQPGYHFTDFSPTATVGGVLRFLKFRPLDERQTVILNLPAPLARGMVVSQPAAIERHLGGGQLTIYRDHAGFPWLRHLLLGDGAHWCHVIYKRRSFKGLPSAHVLYASDRYLLARYVRALCSHLLANGMLSTHVENRQIGRAGWPSRVRSGFNAKLFLSDTLGAEDIDYLYSETMAMNL